jgi:hypothetical protein
MHDLVEVITLEGRRAAIEAHLAGAHLGLVGHLG